MRLASLRVRIGLSYTIFTLTCLSAFGLFLTVYLGRALEASRAPTMVRRAARLVAFVNSEHAEEPQRPLTDILNDFLKASPENDEIVVRDAAGKQLLFAGGGASWVTGQSDCTTQCFREFRHNGHYLRAYSVNALLAGRPVRLTLAGSIDEHYAILRRVRTSYLIFVPFLLLASLTGGYLLSGRALLPVGRMTAVASQLSISDLHGRVPVPDTGDELQTLAEAWNLMLSRLEASVQKTAQFTSDASHDLRTSIAVMLAGVQLALRKPRSVEGYAETLRTLGAECDHTLHVLEDLLCAARSGFEQHALKCEPLQLTAMLRERCALFAAEAEIKGQSLTVTLEPDCWIAGDRSLLHRLVGVLVENAIKYTPRGGSIAVSLRSARTLLVLKVEDTGKGIDANDLSRVFNRAFRAEASTSSEPGSGLGLNIARWIAEAHQAKLTVHSVPGCGSAFEVAFSALDRSSRTGAHQVEPVTSMQSA